MKNPSVFLGFLSIRNIQSLLCYRYTIPQEIPLRLVGISGMNVLVTEEGSCCKLLYLLGPLRTIYLSEMDEATTTTRIDEGGLR